MDLYACVAADDPRQTGQGYEVRDYPAFGHSDSVNRGRYRLFTGGRYDAHLSIPVVEPERVRSDA